MGPVGRLQLQGQTSLFSLRVSWKSPYGNLCTRHKPGKEQKLVRPAGTGFFPQVRPQAGPDQEGHGHFLGAQCLPVESNHKVWATECHGTLWRQISKELADIREPEKSGYPLLAGAFEVASLRNFLLRELMGGRTGQLVRKNNA